MTLREAIERWQHEPGAPANAYDWYRRGAQGSGDVYLGPETIPAYKLGGVWYVEAADLERAVQAHRHERAEAKRAGEELAVGILRGHDGDRIMTDWGYYERRDPFHFRWNAYEAMRRKSDGWWFCNACMRPLRFEYEHGEPSRGHCETCGATMRSRLRPV